MSYEVGKYAGTIGNAVLVESGMGTPGLELRLENPENGTIYHTLWITEKTRERFGKTMAEFGISAESLAGPFWLDGCSGLVGMAATWETEIDTYKGKDRIRIKWLNGPNRTASEPKPASAAAVHKARAMFCDPKAIEAEDDVPF